MADPGAIAGLPEFRANECPFGACDGSGWILDESANVARACECRERRIQRRAARQLHSEIPKRFRGVSFDRKPIVDLDPMKVGHVKRYVERIEAQLDEGKGLWFDGDVGTGKTSLAMLVAKAALDADRTVAVYSVPRLLMDIRQTFSDESVETHATLLRRLTSVDLLLLDDLGAERQTEWVIEQLYTVVNERWQNGHAMLVTTNTPAAELVDVRQQLRAEVAELRRARERGSSRADLAPLADRLEQTANRLAQIDATAAVDPMHWLPEQIGARTVSRLVEICGPPLPFMGRDLRWQAAAP